MRWALAISLSLAALASGATKVVLDRYHAALLQAWDDRPRDVEVVVASRVVLPGETLTEADLTRVALPPEHVGPSVIRDLRDAVGRVATERLLAGDLVRPERLADRGASPGLGAVIRPGRRAESVDLDGSSQVSGFIEPLDHVDVIATVRAGSDAPLETTTILEDVRVLGVNDRLGFRGDVPGRRIRRRQVTLELTPREAEIIAHAGQVARIRLVLRGVEG